MSPDSSQPGASDDQRERAALVLDALDPNIEMVDVREFNDAINADVGDVGTIGRIGFAQEYMNVFTDDDARERRSETRQRAFERAFRYESRTRPVGYYTSTLSDGTNPFATLVDKQKVTLGDALDRLEE